MVSDLAAMLDMPGALLVVMAGGGMIGIALERTISGIERERRRAFWKGRNTAGRTAKRPPDANAKLGSVDFAADQLRTVMQARFTSRALLNKGERRLLATIDAALAEHNPGWRCMGQVSLGEVLASDDKDAYFAVNSKRVDLLIVDADCRPLHAIEFQGKGHHTGENTAARDAVKREALRRAGIGYAEVVSGDTPSEVREMVRKLSGRVSV